MRLSTDDLGLFYAPHHRELAERLRAEVPALVGLDGPTVARRMGEIGLYDTLIPASGTVDVRAVCLVREALGYVSPLADAVFAVQGLGSYPIASAGTPEQRAILTAMRRGDAIGAFALTEPEAGSDVASLRATARRDGGEFVLDGEKTLISNVGIASHYVAFANIDPAAGRKGITAFLVPADAPGLTARPISLSFDHPIGDLVFTGCRVGADAVLGDPGRGLAVALGTLDTFRISVGAAAVGMARRAIDAALTHVRARVQFGQPLSEQPVVQSLLADMVTELDAARLLVLRAAHARDGGAVRLGAPAAMAKLYATEAAYRIIDRAVQLHGGRGVRDGEVVEMLTRAIRPLRIYEGTSEIQRLIIGRELAREGTTRP